jgi:hypothetical protein
MAIDGNMIIETPSVSILNLVLQNAGITISVTGDCFLNLTGSLITERE